MHEIGVSKQPNEEAIALVGVAVGVGGALVIVDSSNGTNIGFELCPSIRFVLMVVAPFEITMPMPFGNGAVADSFISFQALLLLLLFTLPTLFKLLQLPVQLANDPMTTADPFELAAKPLLTPELLHVL